MAKNRDFSDDLSTRNFTRVAHECDCTLTSKDGQVIKAVIKDISINGMLLTSESEIPNNTLLNISTQFNKSKTGVMGLVRKATEVFSNSNTDTFEFVSRAVYREEVGVGFIILKTNKSSFNALVSAVRSCGVDNETIIKETKLSLCYIDLIKSSLT